LTSNASMEVDHPAVATMLVASSGTVLPAPIIPFRGRFWAQRARQRRTPHRSTAGRKSEARRTRHNAQIRNQATLCQTRLLTFVVDPCIFSLSSLGANSRRKDLGRKGKRGVWKFRRYIGGLRRDSWEGRPRGEQLRGGVCARKKEWEGR
jgi:hypothetical protein